jgi:hypothetical protein
VGGSIASSFSGEPRSTIDIDIVAALEEQHVAALVSRLGSEFYAGRDVLAIVRVQGKHLDREYLHHGVFGIGMGLRWPPLSVSSV